MRIELNRYQTVGRGEVPVFMTSAPGTHSPFFLQTERLRHGIGEERFCDAEEERICYDLVVERSTERRVNEPDEAAAW
jgi:hypothetical protein